MFELSDNPVTRARQIELAAKVRIRSMKIGELYKGQFRSDMEAVVKETIQALEEELEAWKEMLNESH